MAQVVRKKQFTYLPEALLETQLMHTPGVELGLFPVVGRPRSADSIAIDRGCDRPHSGRLLTIDQRSAGCLPFNVEPVQARIQRDGHVVVLVPAARTIEEQAAVNTDLQTAVERRLKLINILLGHVKISA